MFEFEAELLQEPNMSTQVSTISPQRLHEVKRDGRYAPVLDVRSAAEYRAGHIAGAKLIPIDALSADALAHAFKRPSLGREETLYITCHTGPRALQAAERLQQAGFDNLSLIEGGTQSWEQLGLPVERCGKALSVERQVQIAIGSLLVLKVFLGFSVHQLFFALVAMIGIGLIVAGTTRWCGMARLIARMPWNRNMNCTQTASA
jgi:rhodanese-related sulfurtransferase